VVFSKYRCSDARLPANIDIEIYRSYNILGSTVIYEWDETKRRYNKGKHGIDFTVLAAFSWQSAFILADTRKDYQEPRFVAFGYVEDRLLTVVFTPRVVQFVLSACASPMTERPKSMGKAVRRSQDELEKMTGKTKTDWARVDAFTDEQLTQNALDDPDNPPLTDDDLARMRPDRVVLPEIVSQELAQEMLRKRGRPKKESPKLQVTLRISPEVIEFYRSTGQGWQSRIDKVLLDSIKKEATPKQAP
jgi:uncharacterized protein (DUF4415 family)/uncharacterized DUF497 family protein